MSQKSSVRKAEKLAETAVAWKKKEEINVIHRKVVGAKPYTSLRTDPKCFINGKPLVYAVTKTFVVDPSHASFAKEMMHTQHSPMRTNYKLKGR